MVIQLESGFLKQLLVPIIPDLELPYTEEECQPLPLEDDDEEMAEAEQQQDRAGDNAAKGGDRDKSAEAEAQDKAAEDEIHDLD